MADRNENLVDRLQHACADTSQDALGEAIRLVHLCRDAAAEIKRLNWTLDQRADVQPGYRIEHPLAAQLREWMVNTPGEPDVNALLWRAAALLDDFGSIVADVLFYIQADDGEPVRVASEPDSDQPNEHRYTDPGGRQFVLLPVVDEALLNTLVDFAEARATCTPQEADRG